ncbi:MAG: cupin domain-containing protein [Clostridiaceae bacterium]|nr:cupin domain-containing protein [Clostridiaceae bacterium]
MLVRKIWEEGEKAGPINKLLVKREETETIALGYVQLESGNSTKVDAHDDEEEIYFILKGRAILMIGDEKTEIGPGMVAYVPRNMKHNMTCISEENLEYLYFANWPK